MTKLYALYYPEFAKYVIDLTESKLSGDVTLTFGNLSEALRIQETDLEEYLYIFRTNYDKRVVDKLQPTLLSEEILGQEENNEKNNYPQVRYTDALIEEVRLLPTGAIVLATRAIDCFQDSIDIYYHDGTYTDDGYTKYNLSGYEDRWAKIDKIVSYYCCELKDDELTITPKSELEKGRALTMLVQCITAVESFCLDRGESSGQTYT